MWMIWNPTTKDAVVFPDQFEAKAEARRRGWRMIVADSCTNCSGQKDAEGWCANYCMDDMASRNGGIMNIETFKKAGICFSYCRFAVFPQIPRVQDVLYILQLSDKKDAHGYYCPDGAANWATYIENLMLLSAAVASKVLDMERYDEAEAKKIIAEAILDLCPEEAKCLFNDAFVEAQETFVGQPAPSRNADRETLLTTCGCLECKRTLSEEERDRAWESFFAPV